MIGKLRIKNEECRIENYKIRFAFRVSHFTLDFHKEAL